MTISHVSRTAVAGAPPWGAQQSRTVTWRDPVATQSAAASMSGLAYWQAVAAGQLPLPPMAELLRTSVVAVEHGGITFCCSPDASMYNPLGMVHGGTACALLDTAAACALHTTLPRGVGYTSVEIKVNYLKPVTVDSGPLAAVGSVVKAGSRIGFAEGKVTDVAGKLVATASTTLLIFEVSR